MTSTTLPHTKQLAITWHQIIAAALLAAFAFILYGNSLQHGPVFDDDFFMVTHNLPNSWRMGLYPRSVDFGSIALISKLSSNLAWQRVFNIMLHALTGITLFAFCQTLLQWVLATTAPNPRKIIWSSFAAALVFLAHPVAVYSVAYLNQRSTEWATLGSLLTALCFWQGLETRQHRYFLMSVACYLLALLGKEHAILMPAVLVCLYALHESKPMPSHWRLTPYFMAYAALAIYVVILSKGSEILGKAPEMQAATLLNNYATLNPGFNKAHMLIYSMETQAALFFKYSLLWVFPNPFMMSIDMHEPFATRLVSAQLMGSIAYLLYGVLAIWLLAGAHSRYRKLIGFAMIAPWFLFWTEFASLRVQEVFVLYRAYLWFAFFMPIVALTFYLLPKPTALATGLLLAAVLACASINRINTFESQVTVWRDAARLAEQLTEKRPGVERIYYNLGTGYVYARHYPEAIAALKIATVYLPGTMTEHNARYNLGLAYRLSGDNAHAVETMRELTRITPTDRAAWYLLGLSLVDSGGSRKEAAHAYQMSCKLNYVASCQKYDDLIRADAIRPPTNTTSMNHSPERRAKP